MRQNPPLRLAINGYGRIGRCFLRALRESSVPHNLQVVAINEPADLESMAYLTRFDSTHGRFPGQVDVGDAALLIAGGYHIDWIQPVGQFRWSTHMELVARLSRKS